MILMASTQHRTSGKKSSCRNRSAMRVSEEVRALSGSVEAWGSALASVHLQVE